MTNTSVQQIRASGNYTSVAYDPDLNQFVGAYQYNSDLKARVMTIASDGTLSYGSEKTVDTSSITYTSIAYHEGQNKYLVSWREGSNSYIKELTVSGTTISLGSTASIGGSYASYHDCCYDPDTETVIFAYRSNTGGGYCLVATYANGYLEVGSWQQFDSGVIQCSIAYDTNANRVVLSYTDTSNSNYGTVCVGTVSGTSVSFGTPVVWNSEYTRDANSNRGAIVFDSSNNKVLIASATGSSREYGKCVVGTVATSGNSISFGSVTTFATAASGYDIGSITLHYDTANSNIGINYHDTSDNNLNCLTATINGTSVSFTTLVEASHDYKYASAAFGSTHACLFFNGDDDHLDFLGQKTASVSTNLTAENYIGISNAAYSNGATATIQVVGSVDDAQSSLTAGQSYYVQSDGSISTTAQTPSVFAGTAVAATKIIVRFK